MAESGIGGRASRYIPCQECTLGMFWLGWPGPRVLPAGRAWRTEEQRTSTSCAAQATWCPQHPAGPHQKTFDLLPLLLATRSNCRFALRR